MSLPSRDYYLKSNTKGYDLFLSFSKGQIIWETGIHRAFNFHSYDQASEFIKFVESNVPTDHTNLEVYRY